MANQAQSFRAAPRSLDQRTGQGSEPSYPERYVICVDYGTTYTGVAWYLDRQQTPELRNINIVHQWPGLGADGAHSRPKVPSVFTYSSNTDRNWGFEVGNRAYVIRWNKLKLEKPTRLSALNSLKNTLDEAQHMEFNPHIQRREIPRHLIRTPAEIAADYLTEVFHETRSAIENNKDNLTLEQFPIDIVITHPATWSEHAQNLTFRAVMRAFHFAFQDISVQIGNIRLATEPEACAQHTLQAARGANMLDRRHLRVGECIIVVDAGGGTVDLVAYRILEVTPNFRIVRATPVTGKACGATTIDRCFLDYYLPQTLGPRLYGRLRELGGPAERHGRGNHMVLTVGEQFMLDGFEVLKRGFRGSKYREQEQPDMILDVPERLLQPSSYMDEDSDALMNIRSGTITVSCRDMQVMFQESIEGIKDEMRKQRELVLNRNYTVGSVFLSGGFSTNEYLYEEILKLTRGWHVQLIRSENAWTDVSKGGVLMGLGWECRVPPPVKPCPYSFGVVISTNFALYNHSEDKRYRDTLDWEFRARDHIEWVISKGDMIKYHDGLLKEVKLVRKLTQNTNRSGKVTVIMSRAENSDRPSVYSHSPTDSSHQEVPLDFDLRSPASIPAHIYRQVARTVHIPGSQSPRTYESLELLLEIAVTQDRADIRLLCGKQPDAHWRATNSGYVLSCAERSML